jgi:hypothetical protein
LSVMSKVAKEKKQGKKRKRDGEVVSIALVPRHPQQTTFSSSGCVTVCRRLAPGRGLGCFRFVFILPGCREP